MSPPDKKLRGNLAYQQRQQMRRSYLEKKQAMRQVFQLGQLVKQVGFDDEDLSVICGVLLEAKETLQGREAENFREKWRMKGKNASQ